MMLLDSGGVSAESDETCPWSIYFVPGTSGGIMIPSATPRPLLALLVDRVEISAYKQATGTSDREETRKTPRRGGNPSLPGGTATHVSFPTAATGGHGDGRRQEMLRSLSGHCAFPRRALQ